MITDNLIIREATNRDRKRVVTLVSSVLAEFDLPFESDSKDADLEDIEANYLFSGGIFEIIEDREGNLLGAYGLFPLDENICELRKMYFMPQIRGRGLGRLVLERAAGHARRLGFRSIMLETISVLQQAIRLYTSFGFVPIPIEHPSARVDQRYIFELTE